MSIDKMKSGQKKYNKFIKKSMKDGLDFASAKSKWKETKGKPKAKSTQSQQKGSGVSKPNIKRKSNTNKGSRPNTIIGKLGVAVLRGRRITKIPKTKR